MAGGNQRLSGLQNRFCARIRNIRRINRRVPDGSIDKEAHRNGTRRFDFSRRAPMASAIIASLFAAMSESLEWPRSKTADGSAALREAPRSRVTRRRTYSARD